MTGPFPSGGTSNSTVTNTPRLVESVGGESELQIDGLDIAENKHYDLTITATNHNSSTNTYTINANDGAIEITSFTIAGLSNSSTIHLGISLNTTSDGSKYLAYEVFKVGSGASSGYSGLITNVTSIELNASTAGTIGAHSFIQVKS